MILGQTWRKFRRGSVALLLAGLYTAVLSGALQLLSTFLVGPVDLTGVTAATGLLLAGQVGVLAIALLVVMPLITGGVVDTVVRVLRGEAVGYGDYWQAAVKNWGRLLRLFLVLTAVGLLLGLVALPLSLVPIPGLIVWGIGAGMVMVVLYGYGPYLILAEGLSTQKAVRKALQALSVRFLDVFWTMFVLFALAMLLGMAATGLERLGTPGRLLTLCVDVAVVPFTMLYLVIRYQTNVAPYLGPPGEEGVLHTNPPIGL